MSPNPLRFPGGHHHLDTIAGRNQNDFRNLRTRHQIPQALGERVLFRREMLTDLNGCASVIHPKQDDFHFSNSTPMTAKKRKTDPPTAEAAAWRALWPPMKRAKVIVA